MTDEIIAYVAKEEDIPQLVNLALKEWVPEMLESWYGYFTVDEKGLTEWVTDFMKSGGALYTLKDGPKFVAGMFVNITKHKYFNEEILCEQGIFVLPEYRNSKLATKLLGWGKYSAEQHKKAFVCSQFTGVDPRIVEALYLSQGFRRIGSFFVWFPN